ncbi:MAG: bifunctional (p)ppGpp synthetase/guanosine-3',5'-bis(diphosphate) 3'-pyrophosphohydrolase, partial [Rhodocyclaceae bacterium]|nr:bifunctional (p)ppGpp synthetase/guanosine-3',5'-bis(diphosphate) 3'-pyrophosphohydrolase [Rhodocyclaceae bacterium]
MVSVTHSLASAEDRPLADMLAEGLNDEARAAIERALALVEPLYADKALGTGEPTPEHARGMVLICAGLRLDVETRLAGILFSLAPFVKEPQAHIERHFGKDVAGLVDGLTRLNGLRLVTRGHRNVASPEEVRAQTEVLRKMLLAMSEDIRVVLLRLASRVQTLRWYRNQPGDARTDMARESLDIYAPLANRLGVAQIKWELEDLSFRYLEPETYKHIASQLDERRLEREQFIENSIQRLKAELAEHHIDAEVYGRPKHIYSIWNKMRKKKIDFSEVYDVRALRVLVKEVDECYGALGVVHQIWTPIPKEFDDYIVKPKGNNYRSLHTAVLVADGRSLEVQIRTYDMHKHAEMGVAAHWRYKEGAAHDKGYDDKIAWLRHLLAWRDEVADSADWVEKFKRAALDDTIYVLTPAGKVLDLPRGATPVDFAYRLHTEVGHRCRGAKVDGALVPL